MRQPPRIAPAPEHVAVIGGGAAGLAAAWLLSAAHRVTLLEASSRLGGHAHTVHVPRGASGGPPVTADAADAVPVDTGFIVHNAPAYPEFTAWLAALGVRSRGTDMSFAVSRDAGRFEYAGGPRLGLLAQPSLLLGKRYRRMLAGLVRFYRDAPGRVGNDPALTLGEFLAREGYPAEFATDHLVPFAAAIWSSPPGDVLDQPAVAFVRFCTRHGLLRLSGRPTWRTVEGGSRRYVDAVARELARAPHAVRIRLDSPAVSVTRTGPAIRIECGRGGDVRADAVVFATHADDSLRLLADADRAERSMLGAFRYRDNEAVLHTDARLMPKRRRAWASWNWVEPATGDVAHTSVTYRMNALHGHAGDDAAVERFVTLNPSPVPAPERTFGRWRYRHPVHDVAAERARGAVPSLQGHRRTFWCGAWCGAGFHEDAVRAGFLAAEACGRVRRPWSGEGPGAQDGTGPIPYAAAGPSARAAARVPA